KPLKIFAIKYFSFSYFNKFQIHFTFNSSPIHGSFIMEKLHGKRFNKISCVFRSTSKISPGLPADNLPGRRIKASRKASGELFPKAFQCLTTAISNSSAWDFSWSEIGGVSGRIVSHKIPQNSLGSSFRYSGTSSIPRARYTKTFTA